MMRINKKWVVGIMVAFLSYILSIPTMASAAGFHHPEHWDKNTVLKQGISGIEVKNMQYILNEMSFYTETGITDADGSFGPKTTAAVKKYQKENGLTADGIVGPRTWKSFSQYIKRKNPSTYGAGGYMALRLEWIYDNTSDTSPSTANVYGNGTDKSDSYRLFSK